MPSFNLNGQAPNKSPSTLEQSPTTTTTTITTTTTPAIDFKNRENAESDSALTFSQTLTTYNKRHDEDEDDDKDDDDDDDDDEDEKKETKSKEKEKEKEKEKDSDSDSDKHKDKDKDSSKYKHHYTKTSKKSTTATKTHTITSSHKSSHTSSSSSSSPTLKTTTTLHTKNSTKTTTMSTAIGTTTAAGSSTGSNTISTSTALPTTTTTAAASTSIPPVQSSPLSSTTSQLAMPSASTATTTRNAPVTPTSPPQPATTTFSGTSPPVNNNSGNDGTGNNGGDGNHSAQIPASTFTIINGTIVTLAPTATMGPNDPLGAAATVSNGIAVNSGQLSPGAQAGVAIGSIAVITAIAAVFLFLYRRQTKRIRAMNQLGDATGTGGRSMIERGLGGPWNYVHNRRNKNKNNLRINSNIIDGENGPALSRSNSKRSVRGELTAAAGAMGQSDQDDYEELDVNRVVVDPVILEHPANNNPNYGASRTQEYDLEQVPSLNMVQINAQQAFGDDPFFLIDVPDQQEPPRPLRIPAQAFEGVDPFYLEQQQQQQPEQEPYFYDPSSRAQQIFSGISTDPGYEYAMSEADGQYAGEGSVPVEIIDSPILKDEDRLGARRYYDYI